MTRPKGRRDFVNNCDVAGIAFNVDLLYEGSQLAKGDCVIEAYSLQNHLRIALVYMISTRDIDLSKSYCQE